MPSVDFAAWVTPNLEITLGGHAYSCPPRSVEQMKIVLAFAALSEHNIGVSPNAPDASLIEIVEAQTEDLAALTLGHEIYDRMIADGVDMVSIQRVGYYAMTYWSRGKERADLIAGLMWAPDAKAVEPDAPKARRRKRSGPPSV
jgi:hypothetical protein